MPNTELPAPLVAELQAERYGMPVIDAGRSRLIASLHALINWLIEHPDLPVPQSVELHHFAVLGGRALTQVDLIDLADALGGSVGTSDRGHSWAKVRILPPDAGAAVTYYAHQGDPAANRRPL